jgi:hypothetical protein
MPKETLPDRLQNKKIFYEDSTSTPDLYKLTGEDRLEIHLYYKRRVVEMEKKQNTSSLEIILLDTIEYVKRKTGKGFSTKNYIKYLCKKCKFPEDKLYSGVQKRRVQRRWAKADFLKYRGISNG